jgi:hypothetical protein
VVGSRGPSSGDSEYFQRLGTSDYHVNLVTKMLDRAPLLGQTRVWSPDFPKMENGICLQSKF